MSIPIEPRYLSKAEASAYTGVTVRTLERMINRGELAARKAGRRILIPVEELHPDQFGQPAQRGGDAA